MKSLHHVWGQDFLLLASWAAAEKGQKKKPTRGSPTPTCVMASLEQILLQIPASRFYGMGTIIFHSRESSAELLALLLFNIYLVCKNPTGKNSWKNSGNNPV